MIAEKSLEEVWTWKDAVYFLIITQGIWEFKMRGIMHLLNSDFLGVISSFLFFYYKLVKNYSHRKDIYMQKDDDIILHIIYVTNRQPQKIQAA